MEIIFESPQLVARIARQVIGLGMLQFGRDARVYAKQSAATEALPAKAEGPKTAPKSLKRLQKAPHYRFFWPQNGNPARSAAIAATIFESALPMKKIEAIIQTSRLEDVKNALIAIGIHGMTVSEVRGHGRQKGHKEIYRGQEYEVDLLPKAKIELVVPSNRLEDATRTLTEAARTGKIGDGKIFICDVAEAIRIRNGDRGESAL